MTPTQIAAIKGMLAYFDSGNNIPVDKAVIKGNCAEVAALRAALAEPAPPADMPMLTDEELREAFAQSLTSTYVCGRVWSAWGYGTMSEDDFSPASECDELLDSLVQAVRQKAGLK